MQVLLLKFHPERNISKKENFEKKMNKEDGHHKVKVTDGACK